MNYGKNTNAARALVMGVVTALLLVSLADTGAALSNSGGGSWQYYKEITISNSGGALSDYQVLVQLSSSNFPTNARAYGADVRFTDASGNELSYWIESWDYAGRSAKIWVKVPSIPANVVATIRMYYGNPSAGSSSNGDATFMFFDDFNNNYIDPDKWGTASGALIFSEQGNKMQATYNSGEEGLLLATKSIYEPFIAEGLIKINGQSAQFAFFWQSNALTPPKGYVAAIEGNSGPYKGQIILWEYDSAGQLSQLAASYAGTDSQDTYFARVIGKTGELKLITNNKFITSTDSTYSNGYFGLKAHLNPAESAYWDDVRIRKYTSSEPTITFGAEQPISTWTPTPTLTPTPTPTATITQTFTPTPTPTSKSETNWTLLGGALLAILLIGIVALRMRKPKESTTKAVEKMIPEEKPSQKEINITSTFGYKGATILYKIKVQNTIAAPIADIKVSLFVPNVFLLLEKEKSLALLKSGESKTVTFEIRPTGECGDCEVSGRVTYYDTAANRTKEMDIDSKMLSIVCPMLKVKEISEVEWHNMVSNLLETEESTKEIDMPAETLFNMTSRIIKDMHMHMLKPEVTQDQKLFNGVARFYGEGVKGLRYAVQVEVVGGARKSKLILKAWAEKEDALTGFYHGILDEIEKRIDVKGYIDEPIMQQYIHIGDRIGTQVKDSVVQHSNIGAVARKCPKCGREVEANEKFCLECGAKL